MNVHRHAIVLAASLMLGFVLPAFAHAHLASAVPAADAIVSAAPTALLLHFTEAVELDFTELTVKRDGIVVPHRAIVIPDPGDATTVSIGFDSALGAGKYDVDWHAVATDGHKSSGSYSFTVAP